MIPEKNYVNSVQNTDEISGTGLGLSLVKKIVDLHRGEILIESQEDVGNLVEVSLPMKTYLESENPT